jgi:hypothetical protein
MNDLEKSFDAIFLEKTDFNSSNFFKNCSKQAKKNADGFRQKNINTMINKLELCKKEAPESLNYLDFIINIFKNSDYEPFQKIAIIDATKELKNVINKNLKGLLYADNILFFTKRKFIEENIFPFIPEFYRKNIIFKVSPNKSNNIESFINNIIEYHYIENSPQGCDFLADFAFEIFFKKENENLRKYLIAKFAGIYLNHKLLNCNLTKIAEFVNKKGGN